jgi:Mrp family chromosome partitioning ATPase
MRAKPQDNPPPANSKRPPRAYGAGVLSLGQLLEHNPTPAPALIEPGLLPSSGILFLGGEPKVGKSILAANLALALASGVQAGREVRILVRPEEIDDMTATRLARDIVKKIEEQLTYPGQIKVTVIRETRAVEYAK